MSQKNSMVNSGIPLYVNPGKDLSAKRDVDLDSWYVNCNFECEGKQLGFEWHQMTINSGPMGMFVNVEFLLMEATEKTWLDYAVTMPLSETCGASEKECYVYSPIGALRGDHKAFTLQLTTEHGKVDIVIRPGENALLNGATGLLRLLGTDSYQYSFPNAEVDGTITIKGKEYRVKNTTVWFDRQWGIFANRRDQLVESTVKEGKQIESMVSWLWIGMTLNSEASEAISLWDAYAFSKRNAFATILMKNGNLVNAVADITYDKIWKSSRSGYQYPGEIHIAIPTVDLDITVTSLLDEPEFVRGEGKASGCQSLCAVKGSYKGNPINRDVIVEMIGNLCGE